MSINIVGSGLICLDIIYNKGNMNNAVHTIGGSCGNVLSILSYLSCNSYPILPHVNNSTFELIKNEMLSLNINFEFIVEKEGYDLPIIIQENYNNKHKFKFKNPIKNSFLPKYKSLSKEIIEEIKSNKLVPDFFYFDRCNSSNLELAKYYKSKGTIVFFEPSKVSYPNLFKECLANSNIVKYSDDRFDSLDDYIKNPIPVEIKTKGAKGLEYRINGSKWYKQQAKSVLNIVDTSGCGDICSAGLICYLKNYPELNQINIENGLKVGQTMSAINCNFIGAKTFINYLSKTDFYDLVHKHIEKKSLDIDMPCLLETSKYKVNAEQLFQDL